VDEERCGTIRRIFDVVVIERRKIGHYNRCSAKWIAAAGIARKAEIADISRLIVQCRAPSLASAIGRFEACECTFGVRLAASGIYQ
jgi:hypothetical protein